MSGLTTADAAAVLARVGPNALPEKPPVPLWRRFARQFASPLIYILLFALAFDLALWLSDGAPGWPIQAIAIAVILLFNAALGLYQERRSESALAKLNALAAAHAWVLRDGTLADTHGALLDESTLTGESMPVEKSDGAEAFSGTLLARGRTFLDVTRTGPASAMGKLAAMLGSIVVAKTPLERRVDQLGRRIARGVLALVAVLGVVGEGLDRAPEMIIFAVALAVAAVPEGLPAVLTVVLALGVERMARHRAVVRRLSAVEALGSVTVACWGQVKKITVWDEKGQGNCCDFLDLTPVRPQFGLERPLLT